MASASSISPQATALFNGGNHPSMNKNQTGGFDADFVSPVHIDYQCPICQLPFREPVQTRDCGHRFCETCLEPILRKPPSLCPIDRRNISRDKVYPDKACKRTVLSLPVKCYNSVTECFWTGELGNLPAHLEACRRVPIKCINNCGRIDIPREEMAAHIDVEGECPLAVVPCKYHDIGCKIKVKRNELEKHLEDHIALHLDFAHIRIRELEQRQEKVCTNGKFLWKISNFSQLYQQSATKKEKEKLCSPAFYSGQYGYKLRAEAFLNGLGQGKGTHLSLYVVIMKGDYDSVLPWPFQQRVDFILTDQDDDLNNRQSKSWRLTCDRNSDYFGKPNKAKSLGFGCPKFVSQETLKTRNYIRDNTVFIMIEVEPLDM